MSGVEFLDELPKETRGGGRGKEFVEQLKQNPGKWAVYDGLADVSLPGVSSYFKKAYGCEAALRTVDGVRRLYVRWPAS